MPQGARRTSELLHQLADLVVFRQSLRLLPPTFPSDTAACRQQQSHVVYVAHQGKVGKGSALDEDGIVVDAPAQD